MERGKNAKGKSERGERKGETSGGCVIVEGRKENGLRDENAVGEGKRLKGKGQKGDQRGKERNEEGRKGEMRNTGRKQEEK